MVCLLSVLLLLATLDAQSYKIISLRSSRQISYVGSSTSGSGSTKSSGGAGPMRMSCSPSSNSSSERVTLLLFFFIRLPLYDIF